MTTRTLTTAIAGLALVGLLGACGGSDDGSEGSEEESPEGGDGQEVYDWVECMKGEGIELPEPSTNADGDLVIVGDGVDIGDSPQLSTGEYSEEEFQAGTDVCGLPPIRSGMSEESIQEESENLVAFSECMRENGVESFPDPLPTPEEVSNDDGGGFISPWPREAMEEVESDPDREAADEACRGIMFPDGEEPTPSEDPEG